MTCSRYSPNTFLLLAFLIALAAPPPSSAGTFVVTDVRFQVLGQDATHQSTAVVGQFQYQGPHDPNDTNCAINTGIRIGSGTWRNGNGKSCPGALITTGYVISCGVPDGCSATENIPLCTLGQGTEYSGRGTAAIIHGNSDSEFATPKVVSSATTCPAPTAPSCSCYTASDCEVTKGPPPEGGTWSCVSHCYCMPSQSPLVLHLPDYFPSSGGSQSWWRQGFCSQESPTVCLDWRGNDELTCTSWTAPGSDIAFVISLSHDDMLRLIEGDLPLSAEPYRHFYGNVTKGPLGDFPYAHGFEALAEYCGQDSDGEIDLTGCGSSLYAWADLDADGVIALGELVELQDLGIESLGSSRVTGKQDQCGNTFSPEVHATCAGNPGRCGTWLDIFFAVR